MTKPTPEDRARYGRRGDCLALAVELWGNLGVPMSPWLGAQISPEEMDKVILKTAEAFDDWMRK